jgi:hypothetical protein
LHPDDHERDDRPWLKADTSFAFETNLLKIPTRCSPSSRSSALPQHESKVSQFSDCGDKIFFALLASVVETFQQHLLAAAAGCS